MFHEAIQNEANRIQARLTDLPYNSPEWREAYAAQQALGWVLDPGTMKSPLAYLTEQDDDRAEA